MKKIVSCVFTLAFLLLLSACSGNNIFIPASTGLPYEVLVVSSNQMWNNPSGRALFDVLDTDVPGLPQSERSFRISHTTPDAYSRLLKTFRNIILVDIQPRLYTRTKFKYTQDVNASPQMIMTIQSPSEDSFKEYVEQNGQAIIDFFTKAEMNREIEALQKEFSQPVFDKAKSLFGCELRVPTDMQSMKVGKDFLWASNTYNGAASIMSFVLYSYPYTSKETFTLDYYIHKRDSVMKVNIPGGQPGQYMTTDTMCVTVKDASTRGYYMQEARGLWRMQNDYMGGPFVSHSFVDELHGRVVVVEAFVFAPNQRKKDIMRKLEAALYTLRLPADKKISSSSIIPEVVIEKDSIQTKTTK